MKNLIFVVGALICVQTINADCNCSKSNTCERDLSKLRNDTAKFFAEFGQKHDSAHTDLVAIQGASGWLKGALDSFAMTNYGSIFNENTLSCILRQFSDVFNYQSNKTEIDINNLEEKSNDLLDMAFSFKLRHNLYCQHGKFRGCEADLNQLRCDLSTFFTQLRSAGRKALSDLRVIDNSIHDLSRTIRRFNTTYQIACDAAVSQTKPGKLKDDTKNTFPKFQRTHDAARVKLDEITGICVILAKSITDWTARVA